MIRSHKSPLDSASSGAFGAFSPGHDCRVVLSDPHRQSAGLSAPKDPLSRRVSGTVFLRCNDLRRTVDLRIPTGRQPDSANFSPGKTLASASQIKEAADAQGRWRSQRSRCGPKRQALAGDWQLRLQGEAPLPNVKRDAPDMARHPSTGSQGRIFSGPVHDVGWLMTTANTSCA